MKIKREYKTALIPPERISQAAAQPRSYYDDKATALLAQSIERHGLIEPITVRRTGHEEYEIIAGERRYRACVEAGVELIPSIIIECSDTDAAVLALTHHIHSDSLLFTERALSCRELLERYHLSREELSKQTGLSLTQISRAIRITELPSFVLRLIHEYNLSEEHAEALLGIQDAKLQEEVCRKICLNRLTPEQAEYLARETERMRRRKSSFAGVKKSANDARFFDKTLNRAAQILRKSGFDADIIRTDLADGAEYHVRISCITGCSNEGGNSAVS